MAPAAMEHHSAPEMPPIPARTHHLHQHSRRNPPTLPSNPSSAKRSTIPPASPEVISNLITSLSVIAQPAGSHFEARLGIRSFSVPASPNIGVTPIANPRRSSGSFGVDYGAYSKPALDEQQELASASLDDLAASPPVIRTARPPSGFSPLTAPQSPQSHRSTSRESGLRRSLVRSAADSRPSSRGSHTSKNDDTQSIGNLSIERGSAPTPELKPRRSLDSWGKKANRSNKGLMYMSSKERLRELDKRGSTVTIPLPNAGGASSVHSGGKTDQFFAEAAISEESVTITVSENKAMAADGPRQIPTRDSSLRKTSSGKKRANTRRPKRDSDGAISDIIPEADEPARSRNEAKKGHRHSDSDAAKTFLYDVDEHSSSSKPRVSGSYQPEDSKVEERADEVEDEGAPFPSVAQGRRRDEMGDRRVSGGLSPGGPNDGLRLKRSSSRLKRLSAPLSPQENRRNSDEPALSPMPAGYERPKSADSVDDAVESYLCSPRLSRKIRHPQTGRSISFSEVGDPEGSAVFCCVGMGLTRYITAFYDELALTLRLRLITPDRPGVGDSEPYADGTTTPLSWPDDVYAICQSLKITKFSILAHSAGAIYALATALRMPQHIRGRIHLLAPWIPPSQMSVFGTSQALPPSNTLPTSQRILRALPTPFLKAANSSFMSATSSSITSSLPKNPRRSKRKSGQGKENGGGSRNVTPSLDKENLNAMNGKDTSGFNNSEGVLASPKVSENMDRMHPPCGPVGGESAGLGTAIDPLADLERQQTYDSRLTHAIWELATTNANPAVDLLVCLERRHTIGFRYVDITRPVIIHHGSRDTRVPVENVKWLGKTMRRCEVRVLEGEGHGLMASATVMASVLMEISKEWEDWMRVTGADGRKDREKGRRGTIGK